VAAEKKVKAAMTKLEMVEHLAKEVGVTKVQAKAALEAFIAMCCKEVKAGRPFRVSGLGTFSLAKTKARKGVNPKTGEPLKIAARKRMAFKAGAHVKDMLNPKK